MSFSFHERLHRGDDLMHRIATFPVTLCGAGALGANIAESLARSGFGRLRVIDRDRIEERNLSTQPWGRSDIGALKASILANTLYRALGVEVKGIAKELTEENADKLLAGSGLVLDLFDNSVARGVVKRWGDEKNIPCLHVGLANEYAEIIWNESYRVPSATNDDICDYPLARNLVMMAAAVACETVVRFVDSGEKESRTITFGDVVVEKL